MRNLQKPRKTRQPLMRRPPLATKKGRQKKTCDKVHRPTSLSNMRSQTVIKPEIRNKTRARREV